MYIICAISCMLLLTNVLAQDLKNGAVQSRTKWDYENPASWITSFPDYCSKSSQSPINIDRFNAAFNIFWPGLTFRDYDVVPTSQMASNNGHTVTVTYICNVVPRIYGGGLPWGEYNLAQYHFHWGSDGTQGSEHTLNSVRYPMELHLVHYKSSYGNLEEAVKHDDGLAVLGIFFEISTSNNPALIPLIARIAELEDAGSSITSSTFYAFSSLLPSDLGRFYRYKGSLTTPTCNEVVTWTIFEKPISISEAQLTALRSIKDSHDNALKDNYRPTQPLNGRWITKSFL